MSNFTQFDRAVSSMMSKFGGTATLQIITSSVYDPATSENVPTYATYTVKAMFADYLRKHEGTGSENNTLIRSGDKQVFIQPPQKAGGTAIPEFNPAAAFLKIGNKQYKVITVKQHNPSMTNEGCVLYEMYVRE